MQELATHTVLVGSVMPQIESPSLSHKPHGELGVRPTQDTDVRFERAARDTDNVRQPSLEPGHRFDAAGLTFQPAITLAEREPTERILPFDNLLRAALLVTIGLLTAVCWALLLWGIGTVIQWSVAGAPTLITESTLWITAVVWPIAFLGLAIVCTSSGRQVVEQDTVVMNQRKKVQTHDTVRINSANHAMIRL